MASRIAMSPGSIVKISNDTYRIVRLISKGGTSLIYEAERSYCENNSYAGVSFKKKVLLKELAPHNINFARTGKGEIIFYNSDAHELRKLFDNEINNLALIQSKNYSLNRIPEMDAYGEYNNTIYIAMNYIKGDVLSDYIQQRSLRINDILSIFQQIIEIVNFLHSTNKTYCHLDLKPSNFIIDETGVVYLFDFGSSMIEEDKWVRNYTEDYSAPEVVYNMMDYVDQRADIYSLGAILYELVTGERPSMEKFLLCGDKYYLCGAESEYDFNSLLDKMLTEDVKARFNSVGELKKVLLSRIDDEKWREKDIFEPQKLLRISNYDKLSV